MKKPTLTQLDALRCMAAASQPLVCRPPGDRWCVADSAEDARTPRPLADAEFSVGVETVAALKRSGWVKGTVSCLALSERGRRALERAEESESALQQRREDRLKRAAMMWLLRASGHTFREIGKLMGPVCVARVAQIVHWYERILRQRAYASSKTAAFERRLAAAGAIPTLPPSRFSWEPHRPMDAHFIDMDLPDDEE